MGVKARICPTRKWLGSSLGRGWKPRWVRGVKQPHPDTSAARARRATPTFRKHLHTTLGERTSVDPRAHGSARGAQALLQTAGRLSQRRRFNAAREAKRRTSQLEGLLVEKVRFEKK